MANRDIPFGFRPIGTLSGGDYRGELRRVEFAVGDSTACFLGDLVKLTGTTNAAGTIPVVAQAGAGDAPVGVLVSLAPDFANESFSTVHRAASTNRVGYVAMGPDVLYIAQEDSAGNAIEITEAGLNCNAVVGTGNATTGISAMELDSDSADTTATLDLRIHHLYDHPDNELGNNAIWVVSINTSPDNNTTGA